MTEGSSSTREPLTENQERVVGQVQTLWPYLHYHQRLEWVERLKPWFGNDFAITTNALSPNSGARDV